MQIREVRDSRLEEIFLEMPQMIYSEDPNWIPHLRQDIQKVFDPKANRFYRKGEAIRWVLFDQHDHPIGRIAAFYHEKYSSGMEQPTGGVGFFECVDHQDAANMLLNTAVDWLKSHKMEAMDGPINFGEKDRFWGLLVENFTSINSYGMNYNPPYYQKLFEEYGFQTYFKQFIFHRDMRVPVQEVFDRKSALLRNDPDFKVTNVRKMTWDEIAGNFLTVYNNAWGGHHGFKKMEMRQAQGIIRSLKPVIDRDIIVFAFHKDKPIGFYVNIPELNQIFKHVNGNLNWLGKLKFLWHKWKGTPDIMVGLVFGVDRAYHGKGVEGALIKYAEEFIVPLNRYHTTTLTWIGDFNPKMLKIAENLGASRYRTLHTYRYLFDREKEFKRAPMAT